MKAYYNIYLTIDDVRVWMNKYTSKMSFTFAENLCSTAWKSAVDTASCKLVFNDRNVAELSEIVSKIVEAQQSFPQKEIQFEALNADESKTVFRGSLDLGKLSIESSKIPGSISITAKSPIDKLGKKPKTNFVLYPATVKDVVERCVAEAGLGLIVEWKAPISGKQLEAPFVVTDEDSDTWRDKIDTLLMEMGGCTLSFDHNGNKFYISKVNDESKAFSDIPVNYHVQSKLKSTTTKFAKDGVVVSYGNLKISKDQTVYYHDINLKKKDSFLKGDEIAPGVYYPFDSDITKAFEEYQASNLDYGTLIGNTRKANNHINLFYVDPASTKVTIIASDMNGKGVSDWYSNETFISKEGGFTYPGGGAFYPRKAWLSFKNNTENSVNITQFSISGDTYYSDAEYRIVMPLDCEDPEEYSAKYIADTETAKTLASFLMNQKRFGSDTSTWTERWENHSLGDKVKIQHKSGNIINAVIVKKESIIYGDELWAKITAVSLDGWSYEQLALVQNNVQSPSILDPYDNAVRNGYVGSREQWENRNDIFYLWSSSEKELKPKKRAYWKLGGKWMLFKNLPMGDFGMQDWMKSWAEVMADRTEEYNYLWAKVGLDGEPFLLQGVSPMDFSVVVSPNNYTINPRSNVVKELSITLTRLNGIKGISTAVLNGNINGVSIVNDDTDHWVISIISSSNTSLSFELEIRCGSLIKKYNVTGSLSNAENICLGWYSDFPTKTEDGLNILNGDTCIVNGKPYLYNGTFWEEVSDINSLPYEMGIAIGNTALFSGNDVVSDMQVLWAFIQNLYAQSALIESIRTSDIEVQKCIRGGDYNVAGDLIGETGFWLGVDGNAKITNAFLNNITIGGRNSSFNSEEFETIKQIPSEEYSFVSEGSFNWGGLLLYSTPDLWNFASNLTSGKCYKIKSGSIYIKEVLRTEKYIVVLKSKHKGVDVFYIGTTNDYIFSGNFEKYFTLYKTELGYGSTDIIKFISVVIETKLEGINTKNIIPFLNENNYQIGELDNRYNAYLNNVYVNLIRNKDSKKIISPILCSADSYRGGFIGFENGLLIQFGYVNMPNKTQIIYLPISYRSIDEYAVFLSFTGNTSRENALSAGNKTTNEFKVYMTAAQNNDLGVQWMTIGYTTEDIS